MIITKILALLSISAGIYLAINNIDGLGWFLFVGLLLGSNSCEDKDG